MSKDDPIWTPFMSMHLKIYGLGSLLGKQSLDERKKARIRGIMDQGIREKDHQKVWMARDLAYVVKDKNPEFLDEMHTIMKNHGYA